MKKIAIFTKGQTELIFLRYILPKVFGFDKICIECLRRHSYRELSMEEFDLPNSQAEIYFLIYNAGMDGTVISRIKEQERRLIETGKFHKILGLRDMFSKEYIKRAKGREIRESITNEFISEMARQVRQTKNPDKIRVFFAIMEIEAWFLLMYKIFERIDSRLTAAYINGKLRKDLSVIDPQKEFFKPANFRISFMKSRISEIL